MATEQAKITPEMRRIEAVTQGADLVDLGNVVARRVLRDPVCARGV